MEWTSLLGWALMALGGFVSIPQTVKLIRTRDTNGLSLTTLIAWTASWGVAIHLSVMVSAWPKAATELVGLGCDLALTLTLLTVLRRIHGPSLTRLVAPSFLVLLPIPLIVWAGNLWGLPGLAFALLAYDSAAILPQLSRVLRTDELSGLSLGTYTFSSATTAAWMVYGFGIGAPLAVVWTFVLLPVRLTICWRIVVSQHRSRAPSAIPTLPLPTTGPAPAQVVT